MSLQPTDRVLVKSLVKAWLNIFHEAGFSPKETAAVLHYGLNKAVSEEGAVKIKLAIIPLMVEAVQEMAAEANGLASSNTKPYPTQQPQPWAEAARSDYPYADNETGSGRLSNDPLNIKRPYDPSQGFKS